MSLTREVEHKYVKKAFLLKFGNIHAIPKEGVSKDATCLEDKFKKMFNASPLIKKVKVFSLMGEQGVVTRIGDGCIELLHPIVVHISLPIKNQKGAEIDVSTFGKKADLTSKFGVIYNGRLYLMFREVDLSKAVFTGGVTDVRDILLDIISKEGSFEIKEVPPNPLRQYIYLVYLKDNPSVQEFIGKTYVRKSLLHLYLNEKQLKNLEETIALMLHLNSVTLDKYYDLRSEYEGLRRIAVDIKKIHQSIQDLIEKSLKTSFWSIQKHYKYSKNLERLVSQHYSKLLDYSTTLNTFGMNIDEVRKKLDDAFLLKYFRDQLMDDVRFQELDLEVLTNCVSFATELVQRSYTTKVTLFGALVGIICTVIGTMILRFLGL